MNKMKLWIRSQDRRYLIPDPQLGYNEKNGRHAILAYIRDEYRVIGTYKSEKRALEVLDEIQKELTGDTLHSAVNKAIKNNILVYEMPKE